MQTKLQSNNMQKNLMKKLLHNTLSSTEAIMQVAQFSKKASLQ